MVDVVSSKLHEDEETHGHEGHDNPIKNVFDWAVVGLNFWREFKRKEIIMAKYKGVVMGALAGTMIATVLAVLGNREVLINKIRNQTDDWADKARNVTENIFGEDLTISRRNRVRKTFVSGAILGLLVGETASVLC